MTDQPAAAPTPGPYYVHLPRPAGIGCRTIRTEKGRMHGTYGGTEIAHTVGLANDAVDKANAELLAAAPAMKSLISLWLERLTDGRREIDCVDEWADEARAVLAKACKP